MAVAIYTRQSLDKTGDGAGVSRQLKACRALAVNRGLEIAFEFSDNDTSATTGVRRPAFEKLLELVREGKVDTVIAWHNDRLYRRLTDLVRITEIAKKHGLTILTVQAGDMDLSTSAGRLIASLVGAVASHEGEQRTDRQKLAYRTRAEAGEWHFSRRPFGYRREGRAVVLVPEEAEVLRDVLHRYYDLGQSRHSIMRDLNARKIQTPQGKPWGIIQVRDLLGNPHYAGISTYNGEVVGTGNWEPMVDQFTWKRWQSSLAKRRRKSTFTTATHLLSGIVRCGVCGGVCYRKARAGSGGAQYTCQASSCTSRSVQMLDEYVEMVMIARLQSPDALATREPISEPVEHLIDEAQETHRKLDELAELLVEGVLTAQGVRDASKPLRARLITLEHRLDQVNAATARLPLTGMGAEVTQQWNETLTLTEKRSLIRSLMTVTLLPLGNGDNRTFRPDAVRIEWVQ
ncbi:recombinase family protein [Cryobacterium sp. TMT2-14]|uniref:recombinase family protein n=1 Tax=Cryobacterium sp. TMT2-14 TaxID=1259245 RepID=UPI00106D28DD|nr:recombinase family protein [Cryobacterium sp. TMT2-14]TFC38991.1 recombinase family protein [Cryobacterium sp. TMT2-14]